MGIYSISGLPSNLTYEISDYKLHDKICDSTGGCSLGITKLITLTIKYKDGGFNSSSTEYNLKIDFDFRKICKISYSDIYSYNYPEEVISGGKLEMQFVNSSTQKKVNIYMDGTELARDRYSYSDGYLILDNITGDIVIEWGISFLYDGDTFSITLKNFVNNTTDATYSSQDSKITYIGFYEEKLPEGYTVNSLNALPKVSVSEDNKIHAYNDNGKIIVYSKNIIATKESMYSMFRNMINLKEINLLQLDTSRCTSMQSTFAYTSSLETLDLSLLDTSNVDNMLAMFHATGNENLQLDLSNFDTSKVTNMNQMFKNLDAKNLDVSSFDTSNVTDMGYMFYEMTKLESLNISNLNTSKVEIFDHTFSRLYLMQELDVSSFDTKSVTNMVKMFSSCNALKTIYVGDNWDTTNVSDSTSMFADSFNLVGEKGTTYDSNYVDITYARVDSVENKGYLTYKPSS